MDRELIGSKNVINMSELEEDLLSIRKDEVSEPQWKIIKEHFKLPDNCCEIEIKSPTIYYSYVSLQ